MLKPTSAAVVEMFCSISIGIFSLLFIDILSPFMNYVSFLIYFHNKYNKKLLIFQQVFYKLAKIKTRILRAYYFTSNLSSLHSVILYHTITLFHFYIRDFMFVIYSKYQYLSIHSQMILLLYRIILIRNEINPGIIDTI